MKRNISILTVFAALTVLVFSFESVLAQSDLAEMLPKVNPGVKQVPQMILDSKTMGAVYERRELFEQNARLVSEGEDLSRAVSQGTIININHAAIRDILKNSPQYLSVSLPDGNGGAIELELVRVNIFAEGFKVTTSAPTNENYESGLGIHYRGMIKDEPMSLAAISIFPNEVMGSVRSKTLGNSVLGRLTGNNPTDRHIFYDEKNLLTRPEKFCNVKDTRNETSISIPAFETPSNDAVAARFVRHYIEVNFDVFQNKGSVAASIAYTTGFFNQSAALFANDGVFVSIQETFVWNSASPYTATNDSAVHLDAFTANRQNFNGDLAHLITLYNYGGIAWLNALCGTNRHAVSGVNPDFENVPTYSWTVGVFTHEAGHNLGSPHTHACAWNGNNTAIDSCAQVEGGCASPGNPAGGGTIMSYCHLQQGVGINFNLGFGPQPKALILSRIAAANCLVDTGRAPHDFDGDNKTDIGIFRPAGANGAEWWINRSSNGTTFAAQFGNNTDKIVPADYTGDGKADIAVFRPSNGNWFILRSEDSSFFAFPFGAATDVPVPANYDGDNKADPAVYRPSTQTWFINKSTGGTTIQQFGAAGDVPVVGNYDGDNKADIAIYRPNGANGGEWWVQRSSNNTVTALIFGNSTDKPVQGDYTGDGKTDIAVFRPSNGNWFILRSENLSFFAFPFGTGTDVPSPGDYDGDGKFDAAVFRPSNSTWFVQRSTAGTLIQQFGANGDNPIPSAYIP